MAGRDVPLGKEEIKRICGILDETLASVNDIVISEFREKWPLLAVDLCNYGWKMKSIKRLLASGQLSLAAGFEEILSNWVEWNEKQATLGNLLSVLVSNELDTYAGLVANQFTKEVANVSGGHEEDSSMPVLINGNGTPIKQAFENSVILLEIFKMLSLKDQKNFRLVNRILMTETLASWRKFRYLVIYGESAEVANPERKLTMRKCLQLLNEQSFGDNCYSLIKPPFLRCRLKLLVRPFPKWVTAEESFFWKVCASKLTHLDLSESEFYNGIYMETIQWILLKICKNLKEIDINSSASDTPLPNEIDASTLETVGATCGLTSLSLGDVVSFRITEDEMKMLLKMLPKLKTLITDQGSDTISKFLVEPTNNGNLIRLGKLIFWNEDINQTASALRNYVEMFPHWLTELQISLVWMADAAVNFNVYTALAKCKNLRVLKLENIRNHNNFVVPSMQFFNLAAIAFPELRKLRLDIATGKHGCFDFNSLIQLPNLVTLMITYKYNPIPSGELIRRERSGDWINEGDWLRYTPYGLQTQRNAQQPPFTKCESLRHFSFDGWLLNVADLELFRGWFPNLTFLQAKLCIETFPFVFQTWENITTVSVLPGSPMDERQLESVRTEHNINVHAALCHRKRNYYWDFEKL